MQRLFDTGNIPYTRRGAIANLEFLGAVVHFSYNFLAGSLFFFFNPSCPEGDDLLSNNAQVDAAAAGKQKKKKQPKRPQRDYDFKLSRWTPIVKVSVETFQ